MHKEIFTKLIGTIIAISALYFLIVIFSDNKNIDLTDITIYMGFATIGSVLGLVFGYIFYNFFANNLFLTAIIAAAAVLIASTQSALLVQYPMSDLCICIAFIIISGDVAKIRHGMSVDK
ncbi:hypothetical protein [Parendozoicomonas haliclonae]|uniref:Uncharacterized protein n=1 Tax=Parendozoicomonas haliclonae TaxID=1960125 RepID=A0A1X7ARL5_9GAMM|nr:hypothetical protein [Parendozoicomonas haliclonae]SMA50946.1 hypothetical protein EHSB41UT_04764 [Parendozoicomonas haliclonae]